MVTFDVEINIWDGCDFLWLGNVVYDTEMVAYDVEVIVCDLQMVVYNV